MSSSLYLERYAWQDVLFPDYRPSNALGIVIVLPAYKETALLQSLHSLDQCLSPKCSVLIIVVVNESEEEAANNMVVNKKCYDQAMHFQSQFEVLCSYVRLPEKKAGVGLARKIGMDEAVRFFRQTGNDGAIVCFDADSTCDENYLQEIEIAFLDTSTNSSVIFHEHNLHGQNHLAIVQYELYLRYYINALRFSCYPYAHQTLGSCIAVRSSIYEKVGGMNTRKAGEDFYFLNKTIPHGGFVEISTTTVRPSDRISDRVPFGTGAAVQSIIADADPYQVYHPNTFEDLKLFFDQIDLFWKKDDWAIPSSLISFLGSDWKEQITNVKENVATEQAFKKQFYNWFDAFKILKFVHHSRDHFYQNVELPDALNWLCEKLHLIKGNLDNLLIQLRYYDRKNNYPKWKGND
ncbi:MAG: hypothetical protein AAF789_03120 [Bacteroidota bacterium]